MSLSWLSRGITVTYICTTGDTVPATISSPLQAVGSLCTLRTTSMGAVSATLEPLLIALSCARAAHHRLQVKTTPMPMPLWTTRTQSSRMQGHAEHTKWNVWHVRNV